jgi:hypothetical protein
MLVNDKEYLRNSNLVIRHKFKARRCHGNDKHKSDFLNEENKNLF